ncbi:MAG: TRAP transporter large permease subunit [Chromatiales bacterium]|nr:TRAP transporter large permease subunit [Chromatiales bacterium]
MSGLGLALLVVALLLLRQNVLVILGVAVAWCYVAFTDGSLGYIVLDAWEAANKELLLSVPLYVLAGNIMGRGAIATRLIRVARAVTAPIPAGLAVATVGSCALFAAVSGSGTVTLLAIGSVMYPALVQAGYPRSFAIGLLCAGGTLGIIIPPSIPLILYGVMTQTSVTDLFMGGLGPGALLSGLFVGYALLRHWRLRGGRLDLAEVGSAVRSGAFALAMPAVILGGIYSGRFTATESAAVAVVYAIFVEVAVHRELGVAGLRGVVLETARMLGSLFPVLMLALALNVFLTYEQVPERLVGLLSGAVTEPARFLLATNALLLAVGCLVDIGSAILILAPLLHPVGVALGIDPVHLGIVIVVNLELGYLTPPMGLNLVVAMLAFREGFGTICRAVVPFIGLMLAGLLVVTFWPALTLALVR